jgi:hypothetical protein
MKYILLAILALQQLSGMGQQTVYGRYVHKDPYLGLSLQLNSDQTFVYRFDGEIGKAEFRGRYVIKNGRLHIHIATPRDSMRTVISYKGDNTAGRSLKLMDGHSVGYIGASVELNRQLQLITDTDGTVSLPQGYVLREVKMNYINQIDTTINLTDPGKGNIEILLPGKHHHDIQLDLVIKDWLIQGGALYAIHSGRVDTSFVLTRVGH